jgi:hypothetical protein
MGRKAGKDRGSFVGESRQMLHDFYRDVLQNIRAWQPPAPKLAKEPEAVEPGGSGSLDGSRTPTQGLE